MRLVADNVAEMVPQPNVADLLEKTLEMARRGEIDGAVLLLSHSDGTTSDRWAFGPGFGWVSMVGCAEVWKRRFIARYDEVQP
jgi:hypothetical protein